MKAKDLIELGLVVGGGYLVLKYLGIDPLAYFTGAASPGATTTPSTATGTTAIAPGSTTTPTSSGPTTTTTNAQQQVPTGTTANTGNYTSAQMATRAMIIRTLQGYSLDPTQPMTFDNWNYYYQMVTGQAGPDPNLYVSDRNQPITLDGWFGIMASHGFSGLGLIGHMANYGNVYTPPRGQGLRPLDSETYIRRLS